MFKSGLFLFDYYFYATMNKIIVVLLIWSICAQSYGQVFEELATDIKADDVSPFKNGVAIFKHKKKFGLIDTLGNELVPAKYADLDVTIGGHATEFIKFAVTDHAYNVWYSANCFGSSPRKLPNYKANIGLMNLRGEIVLDPIYDEIILFARREGSTGKNFENGPLLVSLNERFSYVNNKKEVVHVLQNNVDICDDYFQYSDYRLKVSNNDKCGYIDTGGEQIIPIQYDDCGLFRYELAPVKKGEKWGVINPNGELVIPFLYDNAVVYKDGSGVHLEKDGKSGFFLPSKQIRTDIIYDDFIKTDYYNGTNYRVQKNGKWGSLNQNLEKAIPAIYDRLDRIGQNLYRAKIKDKWGVIDFDNNEVLPAEMDSVYFYLENLHCFKREGHSYIADSTGNIIHEGVFDDVYAIRKEPSLGSKESFGHEPIYNHLWRSNHHLFSDELFVVVEGGQHTLYNNKGEIVIGPQPRLILAELLDGGYLLKTLKPTYTRIYSRTWTNWGKSYGYFSGKYYSYSYNYGYANEEGVITIPSTQPVQSANSAFLVVDNGRKVGAKNINGDEILPILYDEIFHFSPDIARVKREKHHYYIDLQGNRLTSKYKKIGAENRKYNSAIKKNKIFIIVRKD